MWRQKGGEQICHICWHKQAWSKDLIKPGAWRSHVFDEDPLEDYVSSVLNIEIMC